MEMDRNLTDMANEVFPVDPDGLAPYLAPGQQRVLSALQQDVAAARHLLCVTGATGSGKTVLLRALRQSLKQALIGLIEQPTPHRLLVDVAKALQLDTTADNETMLRRRLVMLLLMAEQRHQPIILIVDMAERLSTEDIELLLHFFPTGHATLVLAGTGSPETWLAGCTISAGAVHIDHSYNLDPLSAEETAGSTAQGEDSVSVPVVEQTCSMEPEESEGNAVAEAPAAPMSAHRRRSVLPVRSIVAPSAASIAGRPVLPHARAEQRSVRRWRAAAVLAGIALIAVLTREIWPDRIPSGRALLGELDAPFAGISAPGHSPRESSRSLDSGGSAAPPAAASDTASQSSEFATLDTSLLRREAVERPLLADVESPPLSDEAAGEPDADMSPDNPVIDAATSRPDADRDEAPATTASVPVKKAPVQTRAQRVETARLYAKRAEYEWRNGDLQAASVSIQRGLSSDPGNPRLLEMQAQLRETLQKR